MRFYEFCTSKILIIDRNQEMINNWIISEEGKSIRESTEFDAEVSEFRDFANVHQQQLTALVIGEKYYPISILARPSAKSLMIEMSDQPIEYLGISDANFIFQGPTMRYKVAINTEVIDELGPHFISTTVFTTITNRDQFLTLIYSKFGGRWRITKKEANV